MRSANRPDVMSRQRSTSPTSTLTDQMDEKLTFKTDSIAYTDVLQNQQTSMQRSDSKRSNKGPLGFPTWGRARETSFTTIAEEEDRTAPSRSNSQRSTGSYGRPSAHNRSQSKKLSFSSRHSNESSDTLVGSGLIRKEMDEGIHNPSGVVHTKKLDTKERLEDLRQLMEKNELDY
jgi:hypothetical protein